MELIPSIDLRQGRVVRLLQGDFAKETVYDKEPQDLIAGYLRAGARFVHVVDLDGAAEREVHHRDLIKGFCRMGPLQVGGGIRSREIVDELLSAGAARVVVGSVVISDPKKVGFWMKLYGVERIVVALDVDTTEGVPYVVYRGWQERSPLSLWEAVRVVEGEGHVLCTDIRRDGKLMGPNLYLYEECVERFPRVHFQASGGVGSIEDLYALERTGVAAAISGKALLEQRILLEEAKPFLPGA